MDNKLNLVWENNPDTPLTAQNLSKIVEKYSEGLMLFLDTKDNYLKFRANSKVALPIPVTNAYFNFKDSLISHNSNYGPTSTQNISFRTESLTGTKSIASETSTTNLISNPSYENGDTDWNIAVTGSSVITIDGNTSLYGDNSCLISIDASGSIATLSQVVSLPSLDNISVSLYYKSTGVLKMLIVGNPNSSPIYWRSTGLTPNWEPLASNSLIELPIATEWTRVEIKDIYTTGLSDNEVELRLYGEDSNALYYIDSAQIEYKIFCSSFTDTSRGDPILKYESDILRLEEGTIDLLLTPKDVTVGDNVVFVAETSGNDALVLKFDTTTNNLLVFSVYNTDLSSFVDVAVNLGDLDDFIDKELRIICTWNKDNGIYLFVNDLSSSNIVSFIPFNNTDITEVDVGGRFTGGSTQILNGIIDDLKINIFQSSNTEVTEMLNSDIAPNNNLYNFYENRNENIIITTEMLDTGNSYSIDTKYYLWLCKDIGDTSVLILSESMTAPVGVYNKFCKVIGGFQTDDVADILSKTIWSIGEKANSIIAENFILYNPTSDFIGVTFQNNNGTSEAIFDAPTTFNASIETTDIVTFQEDVIFNKNVDFNFPANFDANVDFNNPVDFNNKTYFYDEADFTELVDFTNDVNFNSNIFISSTGYMDIDNLRIDGNTIYSIAGGITLTPTTDLVVNAANVDINSSGSITLDGITINDNAISNLAALDITSTGIVTINSEGIISNYGAGPANFIGTGSFNVAIGSSAFSLSSSASMLNSNTTLVLSSDTGNIDVNCATLDLADINVADFGLTLGQKINLAGAGYGIGIQSGTVYMRSGAYFAWYNGGVHDDTSWGAGGGALMAALTPNDTSPSVPMSATSRFYAGKVHNAVYNDLAECWVIASEEKVDYGMVVVQTEVGIRKSCERAEKGTIGVVSNSYGFLLNDKGYVEDLAKSPKAPIAISGRVKVNIIGKVEIGDEVVGYLDGAAIKANWFEKIFKRERILGIVDSIKDGTCWIKVN